MVSIHQIQSGLTRYIDSEFTSRLTGWQKWVFPAGINLLMGDGILELYNKYKDNDIIKAMGIITDNGVDIDRIYTCMKDEAKKGSIAFNAPILGTVTMNEGDIDKLYNFIIS